MPLGALRECTSVMGESYDRFPKSYLGEAEDKGPEVIVNTKDFAHND